MVMDLQFVESEDMAEEKRLRHNIDKNGNGLKMSYFINACT